MLAAVNLERSRVGAPALVLDSRAQRAAQLHSEWMAREDVLDHTGQGGSDPGQRLSEQGVQWRAYAENVAWGQTSVQQVMRSWMNSPGHRSNLLNPRYTHLGWGRAGNYWTQKFFAQ
jgi:uncharacterized protein YkwD